MKAVKKVIITKEEVEVIKRIVDFMRYDSDDMYDTVDLLCTIAEGDTQWNDYDIEIEGEEK